MRVFAVLAAVAVTAAACSSFHGLTPEAAPASPSLQRPALAQPGIYYKHIVVEIQENRSFDNIFAGAANRGMLKYAVDVAKSGYSNLNCTKPLNPTTCSRVPLRALGYSSNVDPNHVWQALHAECNELPSAKPIEGTSPCRMNGFWGDAGTTVPKGWNYPAGALPYTFLPPSAIVPYVKLANRYGLADELFSGGRAPSFPGHVFLVSGLGPSNDPPTAKIWGCAQRNYLVQLWAAWAPAIGKKSQCFNYTSLATALDRKGVSWAYYNGNRPADYYSFDNLSVGVSAFSDVWANDRHKLLSRKQFFADLQSGGKKSCNLPSVSWLTPNGGESDHPSWETTDMGPFWVASVYSQIGASPCYRDTAMLVVWDDSGGWFDPEPPPYVDNDGFGFRLPLLIISPYAKQGHVSHVVYEHGSILKFTEDVFGLGRLAASDARAKTPAIDCFDFNQKPRLFTPIKAEYDRNYFMSEPLDTRPPDND